MNIIGREKEIKEIQKSIMTTESTFVTIYGRRRVGKTYLIRTLLGDNFSFYTSGLSEGNTKTQLINFQNALTEYGPNIKFQKTNDTWMNAFINLRQLLESKETEKKIIFIDEIPWLDTPRSGFMAALEHFCNTWASVQKNIKLIICGSASWWIIDKILKNKKGLYNRVTHRIRLEPFTLKETQDYLIYKGFDYNHYQIAQLYMTFGGIPFYLGLCDAELSPAQNTNTLFFDKTASLKYEFELLFSSLFKGYEQHVKIMNALATKKTGMSRKDVIKITKIKDGGSLSKIFDELEASGFIRKYIAPKYKERNQVIQVIDNFTLFHHHFINKSDISDTTTWIDKVNSPQYYAWAGNAFELVCIQHINQIKIALGIPGIASKTYGINHSEAQMDLVVERKDNIVNIIEAKFSEDQYTITKDYAEKLRRKKTIAQQYFKPSKKIWLTLLTTFGLSGQKNSDMINNVIVLDDLFKE